MRKEVVAHRNPKSPISEIFRTLRTNIQFMNVKKKMNTLLITSTFPGEGKSWVTSNLAVTFAQAGKRVILVDSDMRKGRMHAIFGVPPKPGLSNLLSNTEIDSNGRLTENVVDYIRETEVENLFMIPAGSVPPNPSELLVSENMLQILNELKELCDIVIVDGTPCELVTDSVILSRILDSTIVVAAHNITKKEALQRAIRNIKNVKGNIIGVVFNKVPISSKKYSGKYYYYGNDSHGDKKTSKDEMKTIEAKDNRQRVEDMLRKDKDNKEDEISKFYEENNELSQNRRRNDIRKYEKQIISDEMSSKYNESKSDDTDFKTKEIFSQINDYLTKERDGLK